MVATKKFKPTLFLALTAVIFITFTSIGIYYLHEEVDDRPVYFPNPTLAKEPVVKNKSSNKLPPVSPVDKVKGNVEPVAKKLNSKSKPSLFNSGLFKTGSTSGSSFNLPFVLDDTPLMNLTEDLQKPYSKFVGIHNVGNTCFANSIFQFLAHSSHFRTNLGKYINAQIDADGKYIGSTLYLALARIFEAQTQANNMGFIHLSLGQISAAIPAVLRTGNHEDIGEMFAAYSAIKAFDWSSFEIREICTTVRDYKYGLSETSDSSHVFPYLMLHFPSYTADSIEMIDLFRNNYSTEQIAVSPEQNESAITRNYRISQFPETVIIQACRFYGIPGNFRKVTTTITNVETLDLNAFNSNLADDTPKIYKLTGFIKHSGKMNDGHYYCIVKGSDKSWYELNDSTVRSISTENMLQEARDGYFFMYSLFK